jgi:four helix bundle protein
MPDRETRKSDRFDLEERTARLGESVIAFAERIPKNPVTLPIISQLVRAATSVGANYCEADDAQSKKDFYHKVGLCKKESRETGHWLRMTVAAQPRMKDEARVLWKEAKELNLVFASIMRSCRKR